MGDEKLKSIDVEILMFSKCLEDILNIIAILGKSSSEKITKITKKWQLKNLITQKW